MPAPFGVGDTVAVSWMVSPSMPVDGEALTVVVVLFAARAEAVAIVVLWPAKLYDRI